MAHQYKVGDSLHVPVKVVRVNDDGENLLVEAEAGKGQVNPQFHVPASIVLPAGDPAPADAPADY